MPGERASALMVLGTASHVGKSVTATALCRIFRDDGIDVAPFKAQNMSLNSFATPDGREIGRAQATQAEAARLQPSADMNPVLLKPTCDTASQVVLNGRLFATLSGAQLFSRRPELFAAVRAAYERLAGRHELVVLEGAGSPVEMNLKHLDMVNFGMAEVADARCVLVADIDRGGVFAQVVGTYALLEPGERARFAGFLINRFRGDLALLGDGVRFLEERTGQRCLGVVPHLPDLGIAEEDTLASDALTAADGGGLRIGVVLLPSLSNFTDFDALSRLDGVVLRYLRDPRSMADIDLVILPGSKNTVRDLAFLRAKGHADAIASHARSGKPVLGICGGFQMLGRTIDDPTGVESALRHVEGLGLLDVTTTMLPVKTTRQVRARFHDRERFGDAELVGYEIHVGETARGDIEPLLVLERSGEDGVHPDGAMSRDGRILGTYVHGLFDEERGAAALVSHVARLLGMPPVAALRSAPRVDPYDRLARHFREHIDLAAIYEALGMRSVA